MFTQPCFIRKNTPELRKKLEELGYNLVLKERNSYDLKLYAHYGYVFDITGIDKDAVDCGTNEDLFLALAALRDDSDYMQWFCSDEPNFDDRCFFICQCKTLNEHIQGDRDWEVSTYHKATVKELIEYFKNE